MKEERFNISFMLVTADLLLFGLQIVEFGLQIVEILDIVKLRRTAIYKCSNKVMSSSHFDNLYNCTDTRWTAKKDFAVGLRKGPGCL